MHPRRSDLIHHKMPISDRVMVAKLVLLLCAAAISVAVTSAAAHVDSFSYPVFDGTTTQDLVAGDNSSVLTPASLLFDHDGAFADFNRTEGFLLLARAVDVWRAAGPGGGVPPRDREASFNTSFTLASGAQPVAFVVLKDSYPPLRGEGGLRGFANYTASDDDAAGSLAAVAAGPVRSYGPDDPAVGLNVTVTPNRTAVAVWIEYDAAAHRLSVYVAGAGEPRSAEALLVDAGLSLRQRTTETALVGFFASRIQDILAGVRDWNLTVGSFEGDGKMKRTKWWVVLLAVLGSVAAAAAIVAAAVCYVRSRRRRQHSMEPKM